MLLRLKTLKLCSSEQDESLNEDNESARISLVRKMSCCDNSADKWLMKDRKLKFE